MGSNHRSDRQQIKTIKFQLVRLSLILLVAFLAGCKRGGPTIIECGGAAQFACPDGTYCDYGEDCGGMDKLGECRRQFTDCPSEDHPVCGCDGKNYPSDCYANASGVTIAYSGTCIVQKQVEQPPMTKYDFPDTGEIRTGDVENAGDIERIEEDN